MKTTNKESIYDGISQILSAAPDTIRPTWDRVLIRDLGEEEKIGSIFIPETADPIGAGHRGLYRFGVVVAVGPGDKFIECGLDAQGDVRRRAITRGCLHCSEAGFDPNFPVPPSPIKDPVNPRIATGIDGLPVLVCDRVDIKMVGAACPVCGGQQRVPSRAPTECQPGDTVVYDRRREAEFYWRGQRYSLVHEEQSVIMIVRRGSGDGSQTS